MGPVLHNCEGNVVFTYFNKKIGCLLKKKAVTSHILGRNIDMFLDVVIQPLYKSLSVGSQLHVLQIIRHSPMVRQTLLCSTTKGKDRQGISHNAGCFPMLQIPVGFGETKMKEYVWQLCISSLCFRC